jgi:hypothetical protein
LESITFISFRNLSDEVNASTHLPIKSDNRASLNMYKTQMHVNFVLSTKKRGHGLLSQPRLQPLLEVAISLRNSTIEYIMQAPHNRVWRFHK